MGPGNQAGQPVFAGFVNRRCRVVGHRDGERLDGVPDTIVILVDIDDHPGQSRFVRVAHAVAVVILPLEAVNLAVARLVAEVDVVDGFIGAELDAVRIGRVRDQDVVDAPLLDVDIGDVQKVFPEHGQHELCADVGDFVFEVVHRIARCRNAEDVNRGGAGERGVVAAGHVGPGLVETVAAEIVDVAERRIDQRQGIGAEAEDVAVAGGLVAVAVPGPDDKQVEADRQGAVRLDVLQRQGDGVIREAAEEAVVVGRRLVELVV